MAQTLQEIPAAVRAALLEVAAGLRARFGARLVEARLFGSYARGTAGPDSDVDVLVVLDEVRDAHDRLAAMDAVIEVGLRHDLLLEPPVMGAGDLDHRRRCDTALARALDREGVRL